MLATHAEAAVLEGDSVIAQQLVRELKEHALQKLTKHHNIKHRALMLKKLHSG